MAQRNLSPYSPPELSSASSDYQSASRILLRVMTGFVFAVSLVVGAPLVEFWLQSGTSGATGFLYYLYYIHPDFLQIVLFMLWPTVLYSLYCWQADRRSFTLQIVLAMISANVTHWVNRLTFQKVLPFVSESFGLDFHDNFAIGIVVTAVFVALAVSVACSFEMVEVLSVRHTIPSVSNPRESIA